MHRLTPRCLKPKGREPKSSFQRCDRCGRTLSSRTQASVQALLHDPGEEAPHRVRLPSCDLRNRRNGGTALGSEQAKDTVVLGCPSAWARCCLRILLRV